MGIELVCASPRGKNSVSKILLDIIARELNIAENEMIFLNAPPFAQDVARRLVKADTIVFAFPLYTDSLPSHFLHTLMKLEKLFLEQKCAPKRIFAICNSGFLEARHNFTALEIARNWAARARMFFAAGLAVGGGGMMEDSHSGGPFIPVEKSLLQFAQKIRDENILSGEIFSVQPACPAWLYKFMGERGWNKMAKQNGITRRQMKRKIFL